MTDHHIALSASGSDLSGRSLARGLRLDALDAAAGGNHVVLDFDGVECASDSFLDELVAVLVEQRGTTWFREHISVRADAATLIDVLRVVKVRLTVDSRDRDPQHAST